MLCALVNIYIYIYIYNQIIIESTFKSRSYVKRTGTPTVDCSMLFRVRWSRAAELVELTPEMYLSQLADVSESTNQMQLSCFRAKVSQFYAHTMTKSCAWNLSAIIFPRHIYGNVSHISTIRDDVSSAMWYAARLCKTTQVDMLLATWNDSLLLCFQF